MAIYTIPDSRFDVPQLLIPGHKPTGAVEIDYNHWAAKNLVYVWVARAEITNSIRTDIVSGDPKGEYLDNLIADTAYYSPKIDCLNGLTIIIKGRFEDHANTWETLVGKPFTTTHSTPFWDYGIFHRPTSVAPIDLSVRVGSSTMDFSSVISDTDPHTLAWTVGDGTRWKLYWDGDIHTDNSNGITPSNTNSQPIHIGKNASDAETNTAARISYIYIFDKGLNAEKIKDLYLNPYQFLIPQGSKTSRLMINTEGAANPILIPVDPAGTPY